MDGESDVTRSIIDELYFSDIQGDQMEGESGGTQCIIHEIRSWDVQGDQMDRENMLLLQV